MKKLVFTFVVLIIYVSNSFSQIPSDYPFKVIVDLDGFVYITGERNEDLEITKYGFSGNFLWQKQFFNQGYDRGMDLTKIGSFLFVTGYINNPVTNKSDIILIKYDKANGDTIWTKKIGTPNSSKVAYGIVNDEMSNLYLTGYEFKKESKKNIVVYKCSELNGSIENQFTYNDSKYNGDDVGTSILIDNEFLYVAGYTYQGNEYGNDIIQLSIDKDNFNHDGTYIFKNKGNETPTSFIISDFSDVSRQKSRTAMAVISDNLNSITKKNYLCITLFFETLIWANYFDSNRLDDIPTSMTVYDSSIYVTGYSYRTPSNADFATIKYDRDSGSYAWSDSVVRYYDNGGGKDKGSSIKVKDRDTIYVAGTSENANNGFMLKKYAQNPQEIIDPVWTRVYSPEISSLPGYREMKKASIVELDSNDNVYHINYSWDETQKYYFILKYSANGDLQYVIDNIPDDIADGKNEIKEEAKLINNYPNPFNPSTKIKYELKKPGFIELKVYDVTGKEVAELVSENQHTGIYEKEFHSNRLPSGVYFYRLYADGVKMDTKKCLLVR